MNSVAQRESLLHIISEINIAKAELHAQSQSAEITEQVDAEAAVRLNNAEEVVNSLSDHLASLSGRMSEVQLEIAAERSAKVQFQLLLRNGQQREAELESVLSESNTAVREAVEECAELSIQLQQVWDEKSALEMQVAHALSSENCWSAARTFDDPALGSLWKRPQHQNQPAKTSKRNCKRLSRRVFLRWKPFKNCSRRRSFLKRK